jgi:acetylornithine/N-succinyldiaminopimelate aminotransferase
MSSAILPVFNRLPVSFASGNGAYLWDTTGKQYLDFGSGVAVTALGHAHPALMAALTQQSGRLWHCSNWYGIDEQETLAQQLVAHSFADYVFFGNSGTEAIECGIKIVRQHFAGTPRHELISCAQSFHGRTFAALAASGKDTFPPGLPGFRQVAYNDIAALKAAITDTTAGVLLEPVQGEGGVHPASLDYLRAVRALCTEHGLLLFLDEIQTGIGRTGKLFAHEWAGITPDVLASAKGLGGGFPLGACLATKHAAKGFGAGLHGSTFGGNPLAMAVSRAVLETVLAPGFLEQVDRVARTLWHAVGALVEAYPSVFSQRRGAGLMLGLVCTHTPNLTVATALLERGLLVIPAGGNVVRLLPPLIITDEHVKEALAILTAYAQSVTTHG